MSSRKPVYLTGVILLALVFSSPQILICVMYGAEAYRFGRLPSLPIPGYGQALRVAGTLYQSAFWNDQFVHTEYRGTQDGLYQWEAVATNPETAQTTNLGFQMTSRSGLVPANFGNRLWFMGYYLGESYEIVDGAVEKQANSKLTYPLTQEGQRFQWKREAARVQPSRVGGFEMATLGPNGWQNDCNVVLPPKNQTLSFEQKTVNLLFVRSISCINQGDRIHLFLRTDRYLLHREGLDIETIPLTRYSQSFLDSLEPASAVNPANTQDPLAGWSVVGEIDNDSWNEQNGMLMGGQPAALIVTGASKGHPVGRFYRFDGKAWSVAATQPFPFGSTMFRALTTQDGQKGYVLAITTVGIEHLYAFEPEGIRQVPTPTQASNPFGHALIQTIAIPTMFLILAVILGIIVWFLMWLFTNPVYGFGTQEVSLASLGQRGIARLIDLAFVLLTAVGLGWMLTQGLDWLTLAEAMQLRAAHPTMDHAIRVAWIIGAWIVAVQCLFLVTQGVWGVTPGKWCCGIRTMQTTLKPCGLARSLVREIVMCVDSCNLMCWTPAIVSIAMTDHRQRLGDLVADTIVVRTGSRTGRR